MYIADNHSKFKIIPHGQQSINHTIGLVNVRHSFQGKTAIERDTNKVEIWGPFLKSSELFRVDLG